MGRNFFKIVFRFLYRNKTYSILNFLCLSFGLACAVFAFLHIQTLLNHDRSQKNYDRLYSVEAYVTYFNGDRFPKPVLSASLAEMLKNKAPEISEVTRMADRNFTFTAGETSMEESGMFADNNFFDVFTYPLLYGDNKICLKGNHSVVISEKMSMKFFKTTNSVGKTLTLKNDEKKSIYTVSGVFKKPAGKSFFDFDFIIPFSDYLADNSWAMDAGASSNNTWVLLNNNAGREGVENKIKGLIKDHEATLNQELFLFPLKEKMLYFYSGGKRVWRDMQNVFITGIIAFAILLISCFNFINLSVAMNIRRYHEAGIKKVSGSGRGELVLQYLGESFIITLISFIIALILVFLFARSFNTLFNSDIMPGFSQPGTLIFFLVVVLFTAFISGILPALYLASSNPLSVLKGRISAGHSYSVLRQSLIVFQFTIPIVLIIFMLILNVQDKYLRDYNVGIDKDNIITIDNTPGIGSHQESVRADLLSIPGVEAVSFTNCIPLCNAFISNEVSWEGKDDSENNMFWCINTDFDYNKMVNIKLLSGRFFDKSFSSDSANYLINDVAAGIMKNSNPLGSTISSQGKKGTVIGTFTDFHALDLAGPVTPTIISINPDKATRLLVKFSSGKNPSVISEIGKVFRQYDPETEFTPQPVRDITDRNRLQSSSKLAGFASFIAIFLACLGLFGLASFTAERRTKEIGIRKVNGATIGSVMKLLLTGYSKWITIAFIISLPFAFYAGKYFLGKYYFHAALPIWAFVAGPALVYIIALLTVSWQSLRAATKNPVESLRYE